MRKKFHCLSNILQGEDKKGHIKSVTCFAGCMNERPS